MQTTIAAGEFKAKCLKLMDEVAEKRKTLVITKRGKPVAQAYAIAVGEEYCRRHAGERVFGRGTSFLRLTWNGRR